MKEIEHTCVGDLLNTMKEHDCGSNTWLPADDPCHCFDFKAEDYSPVIGYVCLGCSEYHVIRLHMVGKKENDTSEENRVLFRERSGRTTIAQMLSEVPRVLTPEEPKKPQTFEEWWDKNVHDIANQLGFEVANDAWMAEEGARMAWDAARAI